jgi:hypothetical protein
MDDPGSTVHADNSSVPRPSRAKPGWTERPGDNYCCRHRALARALLLTAWMGIRDIGKPRPGETVVVSAAVGAVGSAAGQLAEFDGTRVVLIAGGPESVRCRSTGSASTRPSTTAPTTGAPAINPGGLP